MKTISATEADKLVGSSLFEDYTDEVVFIEEPTTVSGFDAESRADENEDSEFIIFNGGLRVEGVMTLAEDVHSIFWVRGDIEAKRFRGGDALLFVSGKIKIDSHSLIPISNGLVQINDTTAESDSLELAKQIECPEIAIYSREAHQYRFFRHTDGDLHEFANEELHPSLQNLDDAYDVDEAIKTLFDAGISFLRP